MTGSLTAADIANTVRMMRTRFDGVVALVEGTSDVRVYSRMVDGDHCRVVPGYGKTRTLGALQILEREAVPGILAIVDSNFDKVLGHGTVSQNVVTTDAHDLETQIIASPALEKVIEEYGSAGKIQGKDVQVFQYSSAKEMEAQAARDIRQPEDAGLSVGRIGHGDGEAFGLAAVQERSLDLVLETDGAGVEACRHLGVGSLPPLTHGCGEGRIVGYPVVDGAGRNVEHLGQLHAAESTLVQARQGFLERDLSYEAALVSLDLTAVYVKLQAEPELKRTVAETVPIFRALGVDREALASLLQLQQVAQKSREALVLLRWLNGRLEQLAAQQTL